ncbi:MAG: glutamate--tRNA ligase [bacterium]
MSDTVITRFAPSPTGFLHMGGVRTALFSYLYAKQNSGKFLLRIEDTDKARNKEEWTTGLIDDLAWLGLKHDVFAKQSERAEIHKKYIQKLIDEGHAYISKEIPKEPGQRDEVIRFKNPNKKVVITDLIRGEVEVDTTDLGDFVIARSIDEPVYHLAVVVDDFEMNVTHVIRAEEHLSNTPRQILIQEAIGAPRPIYAHLPLVLAPDKTKLSKRKHSEISSLTTFRQKGYLPQAILNFVALMGWNPGTDQEIFSLEELIQQFRIEKVQKGGAVFNIEKLDWINREYIKKMSREEQKTNIKEYLPAEMEDSLFDRIFPVILDRITVFGDVKTLWDNGELSYFVEKPKYEKTLLYWKDAKEDSITVTHLKKAKELLGSVSQWDAESIKIALWDYASEVGRGNVLWPLRTALTGKEKSPDPFTVASILGQSETISRIDEAISLLNT